MKRWHSAFLLFPLTCWADLSYQVECRLGSESNEPSASCSYEYREQGMKTLRKFAAYSVYEDRSTGETFQLRHSDKTVYRGKSLIGFVWERGAPIQDEPIAGVRTIQGVALTGRLVVRQTGMSRSREEIWSDAAGIVMERRISIRSGPPDEGERYPWDERDPIGFRNSLLYPETKIIIQTIKISREPIAPKEFAIPEGYAEEAAQL